MTTGEGVANDTLAAKERSTFGSAGLISSFDSVIIAFSGGVDSAYLAWLATQVLGPAALCVTADSPSYPDRHRQLALRTAREFGLRHEIVHTGELDRLEYRANPVNRCYYCKHELYTVLTGVAKTQGFAAIADGSNADDRGDYRPGRQAAREFGVRSPLDEVGLTKTEIRELARRASLPTWDEPASACLSSRIPYHSEVTDEKLRMIERAEEVLHDAGLPGVSRAASRHASRASSSDEMSWRGPSSPTPGITSSPSSARSDTSTSRWTCRAIEWAA